MKNSYAKKLLVAKTILQQDERRRLIERVGQTCMAASIVAMNDAFGFGQDRIAKFVEAYNAVYSDYADLLDTDAEYADAKLEERVKQIIGERGSANDHTAGRPGSDISGLRADGAN